MKRTIFRPGVYSLFMIALMMYLSCNKQNNTEVTPRQKKISTSAENSPKNELKGSKEPVLQSSDKSGQYTGSILINSHQDKDTILTSKRLDAGGNAFHTFNYDGTSAAISNFAFYKNLSYDYSIFTSIKSTLN